MPDAPLPAEERPDTRERLLDAAERLFAERGLGATSLRAVTKTADANLAAVHYHFGSKEELLSAVVARRVRPINEERLRLLDQLEVRSGDRSPALDEILSALLLPMIRGRRSGPESILTFTRLMGRVLTDMGTRTHALIVQHFEEVLQRFAAALARALPHLTPEEIAWRLHFCIGTMAFTLVHSPHLAEMSRGLCRAHDADRVLEQMLPFLAAGFNAPTSIEEETS